MKRSLRCLFALTVLSLMTIPGQAEGPDDVFVSLEARLASQVASERAGAAMAIGSILGSCSKEVVQTPGAIAARAKLLDYYKVHRTDLTPANRQFLCWSIYPEVAKSLEETLLVQEFSVRRVTLEEFFKTLAAAEKQGGKFDFASIRVDTKNLDPKKLEDISFDFGPGTNGAQILNAAARHVGGYYDIDEKGVFIF